MLHDFRPSPSDAWICAGCGRHFDRCVGLKSPYLSTLQGPIPTLEDILRQSPERPLYFTAAPRMREVWHSGAAPIVVTDAWIQAAPVVEQSRRRSLIEQRVEELVARVALLRLEANDDPARRMVYESWAAYDAAMAQASYMERHDKTIREIQELERWLTL